MIIRIYTNNTFLDIDVDINTNTEQLAVELSNGNMVGIEDVDKNMFYINGINIIAIEVIKYTAPIE